MQVHKGNPALHREAQGDVIAVARIGPTISIEDPVGPHLILIGPRATLDDGCCGDAKRHVPEDRGLEDALRAQQRNPVSFEVKPPLEDLVGQRVWMQDRLLREELKRRESDSAVDVVHWAPL
jgi:hypothetical protein